MADRIQIVVIDDHPFFREGVVNKLRAEPDFEIVGEGETAAAAISLTEDLVPDLLLLDISIPGGGLNAAQTIAAKSPVTKVVMLTASEEEEDLSNALKAGAKAYVLKGVTPRELIRILRAVHGGEAYVTPTLAASLLSDMIRPGSGTPEPANPLDELTEREHEILELLAVGRSNKEIGYQLHLSEKTIKHHVSNILQKLQVRNRVEAALVAQKRTRL